MRTFDLRAAALVACAAVAFLAHCRSGEDCVRESDCDHGFTCLEGKCESPGSGVAVVPVPPDASNPQDGSVPVDVSVPVPVPVPDASEPDADADADVSDASDADVADASDADSDATDAN